MATIGGGLLRINNQAVGGHDYVVYDGPVTLDIANPFDHTDWFSAAEDEASAWIVVKGNLDIGPSQVFRPPVRKLFTVVYVDGDLKVDGRLTMWARGANHGDQGSDIPAVDIRIADGTIDGVTDPQIPSAGGEGADGTSVGGDGIDGTAGTAGGSGGGGGGAGFNHTMTGAGAAGTSFSGGPGGGGAGSSGTAQDAAPHGGQGGDADGSTGADGGVGNPGGTGVESGSTGLSGTGGVLVVIVTGELSGDGVIDADGRDADGTSNNGGGGSGGGSVTVLYGTKAGTSPTVRADGGLGTSESRAGGTGGEGSARELELPAP